MGFVSMRLHYRALGDSSNFSSHDSSGSSETNTLVAPRIDDGYHRELKWRNIARCDRESVVDGYGRNESVRYSDSVAR